MKTITIATALLLAGCIQPEATQPTTSNDWLEVAGATYVVTVQEWDARLKDGTEDLKRDRHAEAARDYREAAGLAEAGKSIFRERYQYSEGRIDSLYQESIRVFNLLEAAGYAAADCARAIGRDGGGPECDEAADLVEEAASESKRVARLWSMA